MVDTEIHAGGVFHLVCRDANGNIEWETTAKNSLFDEGKGYIRDYVFNLNTPAAAASPKMTLHTTNGMAASVNYAGVATGEASGGGYTWGAGGSGRQSVTWTGTAPGGANNTANAVQWTASGTSIAGIYELVIVQATASKAIAHALLTGGPYTVNVGSTLSVTYTWSVA